MPVKRRWTDDQLREAVTASTSYKAVLRRLGLLPGGGSHYDLRHRIRELGLDTSHFVAPRQRPWPEAELREAVAASQALTALLVRLGIPPTSAARQRLQRELRARGIDTSHFHRAPVGGDRRRWTDEQLRAAVRASHSYAGVIRRLGLVPAGGNYDQVQRRIRELVLDTSHFTGMGWNVGLQHQPNPPVPLDELLVRNRRSGSHLLKQRLFRVGLKAPACELCGWAARAPDGRIPVELDHINGDKTDNRLENLRILCPNCHSLQPTHRGLNKKSRRNRVAPVGFEPTL
jgi:hypothetical protein